MNDRLSAGSAPIARSASASDPAVSRSWIVRAASVSSDARSSGSGGGLRCGEHVAPEGPFERPAIAGVGDLVEHEAQVDLASQRRGRPRNFAAVSVAVGVRGDGGEVGRGVAERPEGVDEPHPVGDPRVGGRQQGQRSADTEAGNAHPLRIHLRAAGEQIERAHDAVDLADLEPALQQDARVGNEHRKAGARQRVRNASDDHLVAADVVHAQHEEDRPGLAIWRCP